MFNRPSLYERFPLYKSRQGHQAVMAYYESVLQHWPVPVESLTITTRYGPTHLLTAGSPSAPALLLFHGQGDTALLWKPVFASLAQRYRLYAPDIIGQPGKSAPVRLLYKGSRYDEWLQDLYDGLHIVQADVMGLSLGGYLALRLGMVAPERVGRMILIAPAGMARVKLSGIIQLLPVGLFPSRTTCRWFMEHDGVPVSDQAVEWPYLMAKHFIPSGPPPLFSGDELRRIAAPVSLLVGQRDLLFNADAIVRRAHKHLPNLVTANIIPQSGHNLIRERPEIVEASALGFLSSATFSIK